MVDSSDSAPDQAADTIRVFGREDSDSRTERSLFRKKDDFRYGSGEIPADVLRQRVVSFMATIEEVIAGVPASASGYRLDEIQVSVEVSAKGTLSILGTGGELAGKGGLVFTFKKTP